MSRFNNKILISLIFITVLIFFLIFFTIKILKPNKLVMVNGNSSAVSEMISAINPKNQKKFENDFSNWNKDCLPELIVLNKQTSIPEDYKFNIVDFKELAIKINKIALDSLNQMIQDSYAAGIKLWASYGYRDINLQEYFFNEEVQKHISSGTTKEKAEDLSTQAVARPGHSEHNIGLAVDFNGATEDFINTNEYKWLIDNSANYGFILRYPKDKTHITEIMFEPWHFRYVGIEAAKIIKENNICLEEYINSI